MASPGDLELISDDELREELLRRFEHAIFVGMKPGHGSSNRYTFSYFGDHVTIVGLAMFGLRSVLNDFDEIGEAG